jgi:hypothetical protein
MLDTEQQLLRFGGADIGGEERERRPSTEPNLRPLQPVHRLRFALKYLDRQGTDPRDTKEPGMLLPDLGILWRTHPFIQNLDVARVAEDASAQLARQLRHNPDAFQVRQRLVDRRGREAGGRHERGSGRDRSTLQRAMDRKRRRCGPA